MNQDRAKSAGLLITGIFIGGAVGLLANGTQTMSPPAATTSQEPQRTAQEAPSERAISPPRDSWSVLQSLEFVEPFESPPISIPHGMDTPEGDYVVEDHPMHETRFARHFIIASCRPASPAEYQRARATPTINLIRASELLVCRGAREDRILGGSCERPNAPEYCVSRWEAPELIVGRVQLAAKPFLELPATDVWFTYFHPGQHNYVAITPDRFFLHTWTDGDIALTVNEAPIRRLE